MELSVTVYLATLPLRRPGAPLLSRTGTAFWNAARGSRELYRANSACGRIVQGDRAFLDGIWR
jgi:hypothetical protein